MKRPLIRTEKRKTSLKTTMCRLSIVTMSVENMAISAWEVLGVLMRKHPSLVTKNKPSRIIYRICEFEENRDPDGRPLPCRRMDVSGVHIASLLAINEKDKRLGPAIESMVDSIAAKIGLPTIRRIVKPAKELQKTRTAEDVQAALDYVTKRLAGESRRIERTVGIKMDSLNPALRETVFALERLKIQDQPTLRDYDTVFDWLHRIRCQRARYEVFHSRRGFANFCFDEGIIAEEMVYRWYLHVPPKVDTIPFTLVASLPIAPFLETS